MPDTGSADVNRWRRQKASSKEEFYEFLNLIFVWEKIDELEWPVCRPVGKSLFLLNRWLSSAVSPHGFQQIPSF